eukprot:CAMPEP_0175207298 /NCGR_PEP_ID=MMETSP0093-20121207/13041_1 /TAXON_ID=311494 /ORGANISM="Alexandrium monilatum, Strain CCMP3105" /LENGTH=112 /DNA_ID=CAMNT_0016500459 /DNA_START=31 /DNA_END=369 /DNA_ORIENTATION=+
MGTRGLPPPSGPSLHLPPEGAALSEPRQAAGGLAEHDVAVPTKHNRLRMAVDGGDLQATGALDVHEEAVGRLDHTLELVLGLLLLEVRVQEVDVHGGWLEVPSALSPLARSA